MDQQAIDKSVDSGYRFGACEAVGRSGLRGNQRAIVIKQVQWNGLGQPPGTSFDFTGKRLSSAAHGDFCVIKASASASSGQVTGSQSGTSDNACSSDVFTRMKRITSSDGKLLLSNEGVVKSNQDLTRRATSAARS
ncbi:hypothetical protein PHMEG_00012890 [Phytophthora megakarya]|uniref:Uncharacterized protein n=1 Tax=Phytophthora megakarya TaxID=4795 RepID=A0A225W9S1_9STRA|nr:hypothetical protein PHMEG_00012890 [Phytophthora megakarya]